MKRREFITLSAARRRAFWPLAARAQQPAMRCIGLLQRTASATAQFRLVTALPPGPERSGLCRGPQRGDRIPLGGQTTTRDFASTGGRSGRASVAVDRRSRTAARPRRWRPRPRRRRSRSSSPHGADPVGAGLVASLNRRAATSRVRQFDTGELAAKRLELLNELVPQASAIGGAARIANHSAGAEAQLQRRAGGGAHDGAASSIRSTCGNRQRDRARPLPRLCSKARSRSSSVVIRSSSVAPNCIIALAARHRCRRSTTSRLVAEPAA